MGLNSTRNTLVKTSSNPATPFAVKEASAIGEISANGIKLPDRCMPPVADALCAQTTIIIQSDRATITRGVVPLLTISGTAGALLMPVLDDHGRQRIRGYPGNRSSAKVWC